MTTIETVTLIGIILSFLVGAINLWISIKNSRKTIFINSITSSRIKYIQELRNAIAEYCGLFYNYHTLLMDDPKLSKEKLNILEKADKLKYLITLHLNPMDTDWDTQIIKLIDEIRSSISQFPKEKIDELITITQYLLKLEWEGAKLESKKGIISERETGIIYHKYLDLYKLRYK